MLRIHNNETRRRTATRKTKNKGWFGKKVAGHDGGDDEEEGRQGQGGEACRELAKVKANT